ncbi:MAG: crossover junction endodeoxyribonuclease RuvC [Desulfosarcina sp.]|nr:crossover junction endodeoxyribonuclease RuvC [Desulfobacterales bacterium]
MVKIIGIDPGLAATGVGVVCGTDIKVKSFSYGSINTLKKEPLPQRLHQIFSKLTVVLENEKPDLMVVEDVFSLEKYPKSGIILGKVAGVILLAGCRSDISIVEIPVREAKQILTGNGNADKVQLEKSVREFLGLAKPIKPFHASDALGMALIGLFRYGAIQKIRKGL